MNCYSRWMVEIARITKMGNIAASSYTNVVCANKLCAWKNNHHQISNEFSITSFYPFVPDHYWNKMYWKYLWIKYWKGLFTSNMASFPKQFLIVFYYTIRYVKLFFTIYFMKFLIEFIYHYATRGIKYSDKREYCLSNNALKLMNNKIMSLSFILDTL